MKNLTATLIASTLVSIAVPAFADGPSEVAPTIAPAPILAPAAVAQAGQIENPTNVSQINGQIVPVGDHNQYLYSFKHTNLSVNPIGLLFGYYDASASFAVSNNIALTASATIIHLPGDTATASEFSASAQIYLRRAYSGPYIEPGVVVATGSDSCDDCDNTTTTTLAGPEMLLGWSWMYDSGFNIQTAFGVARNFNNNGDDSTDVIPVGYFRVGYAF